MRRHRQLHRWILPVLLTLFVGQSLLIWHQLQDTLGQTADQCDICLLASGGSSPGPEISPPPQPQFLPGNAPTRESPVLAARPRFLDPTTRAPPFAFVCI